MNRISTSTLTRNLLVGLTSASLLAACGGSGSQDSSTDSTQLLASASATKITIAAANVTASSSDAANVPGSAVDNNLNTHWTGGAASGMQWIQFNLGGCYMIDYAKLAWFNGDTRKYNYTLKASTDNGVTWTTVMTGNSDGTTSGRTVYDFPDTSANVMRLESTGNNTSTKVSLSEAEIWSVGAGACGGSTTTTSGTTTTTKATTTTTKAATTTTTKTTTTTTGGNPAYPAGYLGITAWKLEQPVGTGFKDALVLKLKDGLGTYTSQYFNINYVGGQATGVNFRAIAGGAIIGGTAYSRSELREEDSSGSSSAGWSCESLVRTMHIEQTLKHTTTHKAEVSIGQIHDGSNDVVMIKYFGPHDANGVYLGIANGVTDTGMLSARFNNDTSNQVLDPSYTLGDRMTVDIKTNGDKTVTIVYKNQRSGYANTITNTFANISGSCYFKAGAYIIACSQKSIYWTSGSPDNSTCASKPWTADKWETDPYAYAESEIHNLVISPGPQ